MSYRGRECETGMAEEISAIDPKRFYGKIVERPRHDAAFEGAGEMLRRQLLVKEHRQMPSHILGPTQFWREFPRQAEALRTAATESTESDILCTFVNQGNAGYRKFVVAHPECYWWYYKDRPPEQQCSYEVRDCSDRVCCDLFVGVVQLHGNCVLRRFCICFID